MFEGKNNRILDHFCFRITLQIVAFCAWLSVTYVALSI